MQAPTHRVNNLCKVINHDTLSYHESLPQTRLAPSRLFYFLPALETLSLG